MSVWIVNCLIQPAFYNPNQKATMNYKLYKLMTNRKAQAFAGDEQARRAISFSYGLGLDLSTKTITDEQAKLTAGLFTQYQNGSITLKQFNNSLKGIA